ncbi:AMP-binding protein [Chryseolinea lacunae]|uniref:AMP-binding protein n=1 Tax=Chryseolinea lacunae TaxID=2801331 RepID=A0ABS1KWA3_9BACT|nr:AMP-binding protein [Chryseolinea lacunae]MBL0743746.1 AMP-binding protein [Chryseolinea lacunae]
MSNAYPFETITVNTREVRLHDVLEQREAPRDDFETSLFAFICEWQSGAENFTQHTSGSTGAPKAITVTRRQMTTSARMTAEALMLQQGDTALICLSPDFIAGKMMVVRCFETGMKLIAQTPSANPLAQLGDQTIDFTAFVPYQVHDGLRSPHASTLQQVRKLIIGGAALDAESERMLQAYGCACYATYGMTETVSHIALKSLNGPRASGDYKTLPGIVITTDPRGCLVIEAPHFPDRIVTNDLVNIKDAHTFSWLGRWDNVINSGGMKIIPETLEAEIGNVMAEQNITLPFVIGSVPDEKLGNKLVLVMEGVVNTPQQQDLLAALRTHLVGHKAPKEIKTLPRFAYTDNGKINRKETMRLIQPASGQ